MSSRRGVRASRQPCVRRDTARESARLPGPRVSLAGVTCQGEAGARQYAAKGHVLASGRIVRIEGQTHYRLTVDLTMPEGWHVNAHQPLQKELIPTVLSIGAERGAWRLGPVTYPDPELAKLAFSPETLALYQGRVRLEAELHWPDGMSMPSAPVVPVQLKVQACSDEVCLLPEDVVLEIAVAKRDLTPGLASRATDPATN